MTSLVLFGLGNVGRAFARQVIESQPSISRIYGLNFEFRALLDSTGIASLDPGRNFEVEGILKWKEVGGRGYHDVPFRSGGFDEINKWVENKDDKGAKILIDCTATDKTTPLLVKALHNGWGVVTANKKPLTSAQDIYNDLTSPQNMGRFGWESTCGAGTPFIWSLQRVIGGGDKVSRLQGCLSGTLGYVMSAVEEGKHFSEAVEEAQKLGYTEPDPRDDLGGMDVARKALILARGLGYHLTLHDIKVDPLYPPSLADVPTSTFLSGLKQLDSDFESRRQNALDKVKGPSSDYVLRYVASVTAQTPSKAQVEVGLKAVPKHSPLGALKGTNNMVEYWTSIYSNSPLVIQGSGAGPKVTASGVLADCVQVGLNLRK